MEFIMDAIQLKLCDIQGRLFELSGTQEIPSEAFIKAFMTSETAKALDSITIECSGWARNIYWKK